MTRVVRFAIIHKIVIRKSFVKIYTFPLCLRTAHEHGAKSIDFSTPPRSSQSDKTFTLLAKKTVE